MAQTLDEKGNVIINGFSTNQTPAQYSNSNIPVSAISPTTPIKLPPPQSNIPLYSSIPPAVTADTSGGLASLKLQADQEAIKASAEAEQAKSGGINLANLLAGTEANNFKDTASVYGDKNLLPGGQSILDRYNKVSDIVTRATALDLEKQGAPYANTEANAQAGRVTTTRVAEGQTEQALRQNALKALALGQEYAIVNGDYEKAKNYADQLIDTKFAQETARINALKTQQTAYEKYVSTPAEAKRLEAITKKTNLEAKQLDQKIADEKEIAKLIVDASQVAPAEVIATAKAVQERGGSASDVAAALGLYGGDYLKNLKLKEEINKLKADTAKTRSEIVKIDNQASLLKAQPTGVVTAPNGDAIGIPDKTIAAIGKLKLNEGQANAVAFTSRMIQAAQALDSQLGAVSPTGGFYETTGYDPTSAGSSVGRLVGSDQSRVYNTNAQDFIRAKLRKESGAAIGKDEFDADVAIYAPSGAGLDEKDLLLAKTKRDEAIKSMIAQAGPAAPYLQQYYEKAKTQGGTFVSENPQLNSWYKNTSAAVETSTTQATNAGGTYGFSDNQK